MSYVPSGAPFGERGGRLRGAIDVLAGRYPPFVFGLGVRSLLPVFHFHDITEAALRLALAYFAENGYETVGCDEMAAVVRGDRPARPRTVLLAFDDGLASVWLIAAPLLRLFGLTAVTYTIPGRISDAAGTRPTRDDGAAEATGDAPFMTWPELRALASSGVIEVQSHTWSHSMQFTGDRPIGVVTPAYAREYMFNRPRTNASDPPTFLGPERLGAPLFDRRSRMSDGRRFVPDADACERLEAFVRERGGSGFFDRPGWARSLEEPLRRVTGRWETADQQKTAIEYELRVSRETLEARIGTPVRHLCLPWGVTGDVTQGLLARCGYQTAVANRMAGMYAVRRGDNPFYLKRLPHRYIFALPGRGRRPLLAFA